MKNSIPDISQQSFERKTFPKLYLQRTFVIGRKEYLKNEEFDTLSYQYPTILNLLKENILNTQIVLGVQNASVI